jgi:hypothetical protein
MKTSTAVLRFLAVLGIPLPAKAQNETPQLEAYGGYDYARFNVNANVPGASRPRRRITPMAALASSNSTRTTGWALWEIWTVI